MERWTIEATCLFPDGKATEKMLFLRDVFHCEAIIEYRLLFDCACDSSFLPVAIEVEQMEYG